MVKNMCVRNGEKRGGPTSGAWCWVPKTGDSAHFFPKKAQSSPILLSPLLPCRRTLPGAHDRYGAVLGGPTFRILQTQTRGEPGVGLSLVVGPVCGSAIFLGFRRFARGSQPPPPKVPQNEGEAMACVQKMQSFAVDFPL